MLAVGLFCTASIAQTKNEGKAPQEARTSFHKPRKVYNSEAWLNRLDSVVMLTPDQKIKTKAMADKYEVQHKALREEMKTTESKEAIMQKKMELRKAQKAELDGILNEAQRTKWIEYKKQQKENRFQASKRPAFTVDEQLKRLESKITLTESQRKEIKTLLEKKAKDNNAVDTDMKTAQEKRKAIQKEYRTGLDKILTDAQKQQLKEQRQKGKK